MTNLESITDLVNPFVGYLNSLLRLSGGNENALAESQACSPFFSKISISHPLTSLLLKKLRGEDGGHVVLTGHAGDGKTTLALEILKELRGLESDCPLDQPMSVREDIDEISIIKDLSERDQDKDDEFVQELVSGSRRFLLVSNTGTLLNLLKNNAHFFIDQSSEIESRLLEEISSEDASGKLKIGQTVFHVFNLAQLDNLTLAKNIFERMLDSENWQKCSSCHKFESCSISSNVQLIKKNQQQILDRMFLLYRRLYEYGTRLTIRQLTEHLAYCLTAGKQCADIDVGSSLSFADLFINCFFGDNGVYRDTEAHSLKAISEFNKQGIGTQYSKFWERKIWIQKEEIVFPVFEKYQNILAELRRIGSKHSRKEPSLSAPAAREQYRRALFFLYDFPSENPSQNTFISSFLESSYLLLWQEWQSNANLDLPQKRKILDGLHQVLQEHFAGGVRLPEGYEIPERMYITMASRDKGKRQASQIVIAEIDWKNGFDISLASNKQANDIVRYHLFLKGRNELKGVDLNLTVPFLDFIAARQRGEIGQGLNRAYLRRLDNFKTRLEQSQQDKNSDSLLVIHAQNNGIFAKQRYYFNSSKESLGVENG